MDVLQCNVVEGEPPVLMVAGEIDFTSADELRQVLENTLSADPAAEVDLSGVTFFDAAGIRVVLQVAVARNGHGPLTLVNVPKPVKVTFCPLATLRAMVSSAESTISATWRRL